MRGNLHIGRAWIELDRAALGHNVKVLRSLLPAGCTLMPAVKAEAYGHGAVLMAKELNRLGVDAFCVAAVSEAVQLRQNGIRGEILVLGYTCPEDFPLLRRFDLTQTIPDLEYAKTLNACGKKCKVHLKIDTGMHRLGEPWNRPERLARIFALPNLRVEGAFTHLCACGPSPGERAFTLEQGRAFADTVAWLRDKGYVIPRVHLLASGGILRYAELGGDYARPGLALYGVSDTDDPAGLKPVLSLKARVAQVRDLAAGESAGYDLQFTARRVTRLAVLTVGYGDGLPRSLSCGVGLALLRGCKAPIAGRICMDQTLVDVTDVPGVAPGDTAVLIGHSGEAEITARDLAKQAGTIPNEILSRLGPRLERFWAAE